jgi:5-hydroxyisourate hydrolase-like protein (transthyretin family)
MKPHGMTDLSAMILAVLCLCSVHGAAYELVIRTTTPAGAPAAGIAVQQMRLTHQNIGNAVAGVTDAKGELRIAFEGVQTSENGTGCGQYRFVLMPQNYRWELSPKYFWTCPPKTPENASPDQLSGFEDSARPSINATGNSGIGETVWAEPDKPLLWNVVLNPGHDVNVQVEDQHGQPVPNVALRAELDLQAPTHTGRGAQIPLAGVATDAQGRFTLPHAGDFFYTCTPATPGYRVPDFGWQHDSLNARFTGTTDTVVLHKCTLMRLSFRVVDKNTGLPIEGAEFLAVRRNGELLMENSFGGTNKDGRFTMDDFDLADFSAAISVEKAGYRKASIELSGFDPSADHTVSLEPGTQ